MWELVTELVRLLGEGARAAEREREDQAKRDQEVVALRLAARRIETEIARRTLPP